MATLHNISLDGIGRTASGENFVEMSGEVRFSAREVSENLNYVVRGFLFERDDGRDFWNMRPDGVVTRHQHAIGARDQGVAEIFNPNGALVMRPNGQSSQTFELRREFPLGDGEPGRDEYYVGATVVPEIRSDFELSRNEVSV